MNPTVFAMALLWGITYEQAQQIFDYEAHGEH